MKKYLYLVSALTLASMAGCQNENDILEIQNDSNVVFSASIEEGDNSRTALNSGNNVVWLKDDLLSVFGGNTQNQQFILKSGENTTSGDFTLNSASADSESATSSTSNISANVGYYPYDENITVAENNGSFTINATFPAEQTYSEAGTFGNGASPMVAVTQSTLDATFIFKNVGSIFKLPLTGSATITKIKLEGTNDQKLAGDCEITTSNTEVDNYNHTINATNGVSEITLDCGNGVALSSTETVFVFAMLPVTFGANELKITIYDNEGKKMTYTHANGFTLERSKSAIVTAVAYSGNETAITSAATLKSALQSAGTGNTPATITMDNDITMTEQMSVSGNINLDLGGNTLNLGASTSTMALGRSTTTPTHGIVVSTGGNLTITNGSIVYNSGSAEYSVCNKLYAIYNNGGELKLENTNVTSNVWTIATTGTWTSNTTLQNQGEPTVKTTISGGTIKSENAPHSDSGAHIYAVYGVDNALITVKDEAAIVGDGGIYLNCANADIEKASLTSKCTTSAYCMYIVSAANVTTTNETTLTSERNGSKVVAYKGNTTYGNIVYNETTISTAVGYQVLVGNE